MTPTPTVPDRLVLRQRTSLESRSQRTAGWIFGAAAVGLIAFAAVNAVRDFLSAGGELSALAGAAWQALLDRPLGAALVVLAVVNVTVRELLRWQQRLVLTHTGIEYRSPWPAALQFLQPGWSLRWDNLKSAVLEVGTASGPQFLALRLDTGAFVHRVIPYQWVVPDGFRRESTIRELQRGHPARMSDIADDVRNTAVLQYMAAVVPRFDILNEAVVRQSLFALHKNPRSLAVVLAFAAVILYAFVDSFFISSEKYVENAPWPVFAGIGAAAALAAAVWMLKGKVPVSESVVVAGLFGMMLTLACYPGAMRINVITDTEGPRTYEYRLADDLRLMPPSPELPVLYFPSHHLYWKQFNPGSLHPFTLRRGGLGFYQIDMRPINAYLEEFYYPDGQPRVRRQQSNDTFRFAG